MEKIPTQKHIVIINEMHKIIISKYLVNSFNTILFFAYSFNLFNQIKFVENHLQWQSVVMDTRTPAIILRFKLNFFYHLIIINDFFFFCLVILLNNNIF